MKGHLLLGEHITIGINGMFNALNAGFTHIHVPAAHPPSQLFQYQCSILIGFRAEGGEDAGVFPFRLTLDHPEYEPVLIYNGHATVPAIGNIYAVLPGTFMLRYPTSYSIRLSIERKGELEEVADLGFSVARIGMPAQQAAPGPEYPLTRGGMPPFGTQPGIPPGVLLTPRSADPLDPADREAGLVDSEESGADGPPTDYDPADDLRGIEWPDGDEAGSDEQE